MSNLPVVRSVRAREDIDHATAYYFREAGAEIAFGFVDALGAACSVLASHPHLGSPRYAHALNIPGLRHRTLRRYPWLVLYVVRESEIEVVRVLDARRDIPATLMDDERV